MHLVKSQGADFGIDMLDKECGGIEEENGEIIESDDILWFNNVQMMGKEEEISSPTVIEYPKQLKSLDSTAEQNKKRNISLNFLSTDIMINDCVCSKTNKYKCQCFGDRNL